MSETRRSRCAAECGLYRALLVVIMAAAAAIPAARAQTQADELAKKLSNPVSSLISVPFQLNWDTGIGPADQDKWLLNIQPVIPIGLSPKWNLIERVILPVVDAPYGAGSGISDLTFQTFFSPAEPTAGGTTWGLGPVLIAPTASKDSLGTEKWSAGPTFVILQQKGPWTRGILMLNTWSFAGSSDRAEVNAGFFQPFLARAMGGGVTVSINAEATANWDADEVWSVPLNLGASKVVRIGKQMASVAGGVRYYVEKPTGGPDWGLRFAFTLLFPR